MACGSRTGLFVGDPLSTTGVVRSPEFCVRGDFSSGYGDVGLHLLLDSSLSMDDASKWNSATAAVSALVDDPSAAGLELGLQFFPLGEDCDPDHYALPAVALDFLPGNADKVKTALASRQPKGNTPMAPALRGAVSYVRALRLADSSRDVAVVLVTDGAPDTCQSSTRTVVEIATEAASVEPRVRTFVVGLANGYVTDMNRIAAAGGTGEAILIDSDPSTAQKLVTTLKTVRDTQRLCRYAVPDAGAAKPTADDVSVSMQITPDSMRIPLPRVASAGQCGNGGFFVDDAANPKAVSLCPSTCLTVHSDTRSHVEVVLGCGEGAPEGGAIDPDAGPCHGLDFFCVPSCGSTENVPPVCSGGLWACPPGSVTADSCTTCPAQPHGCCKGDGTLANASCVAGKWVCPPGAVIFGTGSCKPPDVCAPLLPCAPGQYCKVPDLSCGAATRPGSCVPVPTACPGDDAPVCGCDGVTYGNECAASAGGTDVSTTAACKPPAATFRCGPRFCRVRDEICRKTTTLASSVAPDSYACVPQAPSCLAGCNTDPNNRCSLCETCAPGKKCGFTCGSDPSGGRTLDCTVL